MMLPITTSLHMPLRLKVRLVRIDNFPKIIAGGIPVTPLNVALERRGRDKGATRASLDTYARAGVLYVEFCAHRGSSLIDLTNEEFIWFKDALQGRPFLNADGQQVCMDGDRGARSCDLVITLLYSLAIDIEELYGVSFDWRRYRGVPRELVDVVRSLKGSTRTKVFQREHQIKFVNPKIVGLPDAQFKKMIRAAYERWGHALADGDKACGKPAELRRGALFYRNVGILLVLRFAGSRRCEVTKIRLQDIDRQNSLLYLTTKGHGSENGNRLPVLLFPTVRDTIDWYIKHYRPTNSRADESRMVFLSHSTRNYGEAITDQSVRAIVDTLRPSLDPPWDELTTPHTLRHSFGYDLQKYGGERAVTTGMRHASVLSSLPYAAGPEHFAEELLAPSEAKLQQLFAEFGIPESIE